MSGMKLRVAMVTAVALSVSVLAGVALAASSPAVATTAASGIKDTSAVLNGTVNPSGTGTSYYFQWGLNTSYGVTTAVHSAGSGTKAVAVHTTAESLIPGTTYHYRLVATNKYGTSVGADRTFTTAGHPPPGVSTGPVSQVGPNSATVTGVINPNGATTYWAFQYGLTTSYGNQTTGGVVAGNSPPVTVSQPLTGLEAGTIFHYRLVAVHGASVVQDGADATFMTYPLHRSVPSVTRHSTPLKSKHKPFTFTTTGTVHPPAAIPDQFACTGEVGLRYFTGGKRVAFALVALQPNCTFSSQQVFNRLPGRGPKNRVVTVHLLIHFRGNGYIAPSNARTQTLTLG